MRYAIRLDVLLRLDVTAFYVLRPKELSDCTSHVLRSLFVHLL
jgi:hypothetical protein